MNRTPTVAAVIAGDLAAYGARCCFGLLGTANFKISHALVEAGVELISARHECNAASMGDAYAKATGELTLVSVHSGPGLTNALTGIGEAAKSRTPDPSRWGTAWSWRMSTSHAMRFRERSRCGRRLRTART